MPLSLPVPIMGDYALDASPIYDTLMDQAYSTLFMRAEVFNIAKNVHSVVNAPKDLRTVSFVKPNSLELVLNEYTADTLFASMMKAGDLHITITDDMVFSATKFLHLRTSDFRYYLHGLMQFGDVKMRLAVSCTKEPRVIFGKDNELKIASSELVDFIIDGTGKSAIKMELVGETSLSAWTDDEKNLYAKVNGIVIAGLSVKSCDFMDKTECPTNAEPIKGDFNTLFKFVGNAVNAYVFGQAIHIPDEIAVGPVKVHIPAAKLRITEGIFGVAATISFTS